MVIKGNEIVLPVTEPETEWILGKAVRKVSPRRTHAVLQRKLGSMLAAWAQGRGEVGTEWRFRPAPPGELHRPLVPDVSYVSYERLRGLHGDDLELPKFSPDVAFEIRSPGDRAERIAHKVGVYLATGAALVVVVQPADRTVALHDRDGVRVLRDGETLAHAALPGFSIALDELFAAAERTP